MSSLLLPAAYLGGCITAMSIFSHFYRNFTGYVTSEPWFPENVEKEKCIALLTCEPKVPAHHIEAALRRRAMEGLRRLVQVQQEKPVLAQLKRNGSIDDYLFRDFSSAEEETMQELREIVMTANQYKNGWGIMEGQNGNPILTEAALLIECEKQQKVMEKMKLRLEVEKKRQEDEEKNRPILAEQAERELLQMEEDEKKKGNNKK